MAQVITGTESDSVINAVVFDVDGTLLNTIEFISNSYEQTCAHYGLRVPTRAEIAKIVGLPIEEYYKALVPRLEDPTELIAYHRGVQKETMHLISVYEGIPVVLEHFLRQGKHLAVFSSRRASLKPSLKITGLNKYFGVVIDGGDIDPNKQKPNPEGIYLALGALAIAPDRAAMVGDAPVDMLAGLKAGVAKRIAVTWGFGKRKDLKEAGYDHMIHKRSSLMLVIK